MNRFRLLHITILLAAILAVVPVHAQIGGSTAYNFLDITSSARIYGMGG